jgi:hypothetical protein
MIGKPGINPLTAAMWQMVKTRAVMELKLSIDDRARITVSPQVFAKLVTASVRGNVLHWRYEPVKVNGKPVPSEHTVILSLRPGHN